MQNEGGLPDGVEEVLAKSEELRGKVTAKSQEIVSLMKSVSAHAPEEVSEPEARLAREVNTHLEVRSARALSQPRASKQTLCSLPMIPDTRRNRLLRKVCTRGESQSCERCICVV